MSSASLIIIVIASAACAAFLGKGGASESPVARGVCCGISSYYDPEHHYGCSFDETAANGTVICLHGGNNYMCPLNHTAADYEYPCNQDSGYVYTTSKSVALLMSGELKALEHSALRLGPSATFQMFSDTTMQAASNISVGSFARLEQTAELVMKDSSISVAGSQSSCTAASLRLDGFVHMTGASFSFGAESTSYFRIGQKVESVPGARIVTGLRSSFHFDTSFTLFEGSLILGEEAALSLKPADKVMLSGTIRLADRASFSIDGVDLTVVDFAGLHIGQNASLSLVGDFSCYVFGADVEVPPNARLRITDVNDPNLPKNLLCLQGPGARNL